MGMFGMFSSSREEKKLSGPIGAPSAVSSESAPFRAVPRKYRAAMDTTPNPNPYKFRVKRAEEVGSFVCAMVNYPHATTYEGDKTLMLRDTSAEELEALDVLDPHFDEDSAVVARFEPTEEGWESAILFAQLKTMLDER